MPDHCRRLYHDWISPLLHSLSGASGACRFQPTCSEYAGIAVAQHGMARGSALALWRLLRCSPLSRGGFDPVPGTYCPSAVQASAVQAHPLRTDDPRHLP